MFGKSKRFDYFEAFRRQAEFACLEADLLAAIVDTYDPDTIFEKLTEAHRIEHDADQVNHEIYINLAGEFVAPLEREDISDLALDLDNVTDSIEDVIQHLYMYNIKEVPQQACDVVEVIRQAVRALRDALVDFPTFKRSTATLGHLVDVNTLEERGDELYTKAIHQLFSNPTDPYLVIAWDKVYRKLEGCCDACEHVADVVQTIIMKNS